MIDVYTMCAKIPQRCESLSLSRSLSLPPSLPPSLSLSLSLPPSLSLILCIHEKCNICTEYIKHDLGINTVQYTLYLLLLLLYTMYNIHGRVLHVHTINSIPGRESSLRRASSSVIFVGYFASRPSIAPTSVRNRQS